MMNNVLNIGTKVVRHSRETNSHIFVLFSFFYNTIMNIAIIGGGVTGLAAAHELTKRGEKVTGRKKIMRVYTLEGRLTACPTINPPF